MDTQIDWFNTKNIENLKSTLPTAIGTIICYVILWLLINKLIRNKQIKAIVISLTTPFFFYYAVLNLLYPLTMLLHISKVDPLGLTIGLIFALLKPLSLISGALVAWYLIKK